MMGKIKVYDFFSGCGGASLGFQEAGMDITLSIDIDSNSIKTFSYNIPNAILINKDIRLVNEEDIEVYFDRNLPSLFSACAPCQPFSKIKRARANDDRIHLLAEFSRFVKYYKPDYIFLENVPGIQNRYGDDPLNSFLVLLNTLGYTYTIKVIEAQSYGVPQKRSRLVLIASSSGAVSFPKPTHGYKSRPYSTVKNWIWKLPPIEAGQTHSIDPMHRSASLSNTNLLRIKMTPPEKGRESWSEDLVLECHKDHTGHSDVYGRMKWNLPASTLTTRCISLSNGRFGHPEQNRAISLREAALLQTFPRQFLAFGSLNSMARQIGNAVPPLLAKKIGRQFVKHFLTLGKI